MSSSHPAHARARGTAPITREALVELEFHTGLGLPRSDERDARGPRGPRPGPASSQGPTGPSAIVDFWREAGPARWFAKDPAFDRRFRELFLAQHEAAGCGELAGWQVTPQGALALLLLLDQFPRNAFRGTPRMYTTDALARDIARAAIDAGYDRAVQVELRLFFYLPFGHSEDLADQQRAVALCRSLGQPDLAHAERHRDIVRRFGRFPHRNPILGRAMTQEEQQFLDAGGYSG